MLNAIFRFSPTGPISLSGGQCMNGGILMLPLQLPGGLIRLFPVEDMMPDQLTSVYILLMTEREYRPSVVGRSVLRTAAEKATFASARSYDAPGYFFDISAGKNLGPFRVAISTGFLCWQTDNGRQNDAIMFGTMASCQLPWASISAQYGGYWGWERDGDFPRTIRTRIDGGPSQWPIRPFLQYQHGFHDWPFDQFRLGIAITTIKR